MANNMILRGRRYNARLFIPADLRADIGRAEIVRSLHTNNKQHAKLLLRGVQRIAEHLFFCERLGMVPKANISSLLAACIDNTLYGWNDTGQISPDKELERIIRRVTTNSKLSLKHVVSKWLEQKRVIGLTAGTLKMYNQLSVGDSVLRSQLLGRKAQQPGDASVPPGPAVTGNQEHHNHAASPSLEGDRRSGLRKSWSGASLARCLLPA